MRVYISGPITKDKNFYNKFIEAEKQLKEAGCEVVNPARIGAMLPKSFTHGEFMDIDYVLIQKCDAIYMLKGWNTSSGAKNELNYAREHGLKTLFQIRKKERIEVE